MYVCMHVCPSQRGPNVFLVFRPPDSLSLHAGGRVGHPVPLASLAWLPRWKSEREEIMNSNEGSQTAKVSIVVHLAAKEEEKKKEEKRTRGFTTPWMSTRRSEKGHPAARAILHLLLRDLTRGRNPEIYNPPVLGIVRLRTSTRVESREALCRTIPIYRL